EAAVSLSDTFNEDDGRIDAVENRQPAYDDYDDAGIVTLPSAPVEQAPATTPSTPPATTGGTYYPQQPTYTPYGPSYIAPAPTYTVVTVPSSTNYSGRADLTVDILEIGYLKRSNDTGSFVRSSRVPDGKEGAIKFRIKNQGTNISDRTTLEIYVENDDNNDVTERATVREIPPGRSLDGVGTFEANADGKATVRVEIDPRNDVRESNERNNTDRATIDVRD
ncbi:MAG TPA: CARDB domain-containing protein, partial [Candidatus Paceibacterota bacterium]|nr:CARDB domain-containing protein [Candidatus Paceibacterota bacterium]